MVVKGVGRSGAAWKLTGYSGTGPKKGTWRLSGIEDVTRRINLELLKLKARSHAGLVEAATLILNDANKTSPTVPVGKTGVLRASTFVTPLFTPKNKDPYVVLGYGTNYAAAVHEMMESPSGKPINWTRVGSGPKFLEASLKRNSAKVIHIISTTP